MEKYFLKPDLKAYFPGGVVPDSFAKAAQHMKSIQINYDRARTRLIQISGSDKLINIIEAESGDYDRRMAFIETTITELLAGADYSQCETIEDMSKVYSGSVLRRLGF